MSKSEQFIKLPPYVDFRDQTPNNPRTVYSCTCGHTSPGSAGTGSHIACPACKGIAVRLSYVKPSDVTKAQEVAKAPAPIQGGPNCNVCPEDLKNVCECWWVHTCHWPNCKTPVPPYGAASRIG